MSLHYKNCGLTNVWLKSGYKAHETKYGIAYSYEDIDGLYSAITMQLCASQREINPDVLRFLRKRLGYSQGELGAELGYTSQAVAKWEKGTSKIPLAVMQLLRLLCLNKFSPRTSLHDAFKKNNTLSTERLEFEYTNSMWKVVGAKGVVPDVQADIALLKSASMYSTYFAEGHLQPLAFVKLASINNPADIRRVIRKAVKFQAATTGEVGVVNIFKVQPSDPTSDAVLSSAATFRSVKLDANSITLGNC